MVYNFLVSFAHVQKYYNNSRSSQLFPIIYQKFGSESLAISFPVCIYHMQEKRNSSRVGGNDIEHSALRKSSPIYYADYSKINSRMVTNLALTVLYGNVLTSFLS